MKGTSNYCLAIIMRTSALGVLCCFALFVCSILLASFYLPSHLSFKNMYIYIYDPISVSQN